MLKSLKHMLLWIPLKVVCGKEAKSDDNCHISQSDCPTEIPWTYKNVVLYQAKQRAGTDTCLLANAHVYHFLWSISWLLSISINYYLSSIIGCRSTAMSGGRKPPTKTTSTAAKHAPALPGTRTPVRVSQSAATATRGAGLSTCADVVCDLCCANICENEEDAVQCEGACGMWYHRYCIGVSRSQFQIFAVL